MDDCQPLAHEWVDAALTHGSVFYQDQTYTPQECFIHSLELDSSSPAAWFHLSTTLQDDHEAVAWVKSMSYSQLHCLQQCLRHDKTFRAAWLALADGLHDANDCVVVAKKSYSKIRCLEEALNCDADDGDTWCLLGRLLPDEDHAVVVVDGSTVNRRYCFVKAIAHHTQYLGVAWLGVGIGLQPGESVDVGEWEYQRGGCIVEALKADESDAAAWLELGNSMAETEHVEITDQLYEKHECYLQALHRDETLSGAWLSLGALLQDGRRVLVNGTEYDSDHCALRAVEQDDTNSDAWRALGDVLNGGGTVTLANGNTGTKLDCYVEALTHDVRNGDAWAAVGDLVLDDEKSATVTINGRERTKQDCYIEAVSNGADSAWIKLAATMKWHLNVCINGRDVNHIACTRNALQHALRCPDENARTSMEILVWDQFLRWPRVYVLDDDIQWLQGFIKRVPQNAKGWLCAARLYPRDGTITVDKSYTRIHCCEKCLEIDPQCSKAWATLGTLVLQEKKIESVSVLGCRYTWRQCYQRAMTLELDPEYKLVIKDNIESAIRTHNRTNPTQRITF